MAGQQIEQNPLSGVYISYRQLANIRALQVIFFAYLCLTVPRALGLFPPSLLPALTRGLGEEVADADGRWAAVDVFPEREPLALPVPLWVVEDPLPPVWVAEDPLPLPPAPRA